MRAGDADQVGWDTAGRLPPPARMTERESPMSRSKPTRPPLFAELCAGLASMSLMLQHGRHCKPPVSRMGNKHGYALAILRVMGLRPGQRAEQYLWCEPDPGCRALLTAYTDPALMREAAEIIRGWKDEDPRALWERLRAEGPIREIGNADEVARVKVLWSWCYRKGEPDSGLDGSALRGNPGTPTSNAWKPRTAEAEAAMMDDAWARLTPSDAAREVARHVLGGVWSYRQSEPDSGFVGPGQRRQDTTATATATATARVARAGGLPATIVPDAREIHPPPLPPGVVVYADFPYLGDGTQKITGYGHDLTLDDQCEIVRRWDAAGAAVYVSECVDRRADFGGNFKWAVDITNTRIGQRRTFSTEVGRQEWVTCNRPPAWRPAVQRSLF